MDGSYNPTVLNAWGTPHSAVASPWLYTGRELDEESGIYFYRARYYDSLKGRFLERDPLGFDAGMNLYEYLNSRPTCGTDPTGRDAESEFYKICVKNGMFKSDADDILTKVRQLEVLAPGHGVLSQVLGHAFKLESVRVEVPEHLELIMDGWRPAGWEHDGCASWANIIHKDLVDMRLQGVKDIRRVDWDVLDAAGQQHGTVEMTFSYGTVMYLDNGWAGNGRFHPKNFYTNKGWVALNEMPNPTVVAMDKAQAERDAASKKQQYTSEEGSYPPGVPYYPGQGYYPGHKQNVERFQRA